MTLEDLSAHQTDIIQPIQLEFEGVVMHQCPPNGQGLTALYGKLLRRSIART